jgi:hypothetical protein
MLTPQEKAAKKPWRLRAFGKSIRVDRRIFCLHDGRSYYTKLGLFKNEAAAIYAIALTQEE